MKFRQKWVQYKWIDELGLREENKDEMYLIFQRNLERRWYSSEQVTGFITWLFQTRQKELIQH